MADGWTIPDGAALLSGLEDKPVVEADPGWGWALSPVLDRGDRTDDGGPVRYSAG